MQLRPVHVLREVSTPLFLASVTLRNNHFKLCHGTIYGILGDNRVFLSAN